MSRFCLLRLLRLLSLQVDAILPANPLYCSRWQHLRVAFHSKTSKTAAIFSKPPLKCAVTDASSICEFIFVCAFHGILFFVYKGTTFSRHLQEKSRQKTK